MKWKDFVFLSDAFCNKKFLTMKNDVKDIRDSKFISMHILTRKNMNIDMDINTERRRRG
jgi:hypothetical protein